MLSGPAIGFLQNKSAYWRMTMALDGSTLDISKILNKLRWTDENVIVHTEAKLVLCSATMALDWVFALFSLIFQPMLNFQPYLMKWGLKLTHSKINKNMRFSPFYITIIAVLLVMQDYFSVPIHIIKPWLDSKTHIKFAI